MVVDAQRDDAVIRKPAVLHSLSVALAIEFHAEHRLVVHSSDHIVVGLAGACLSGVIDARGSRLIDAVSCGEGGVVVAEGKVADALFGIGEDAALGAAALAAQAGCAVRLVGDEDARGNARLLERLRDAAAALVCAEYDARALAALPLPHPFGYDIRVGCDHSLDLRGADIAVVHPGISAGIARVFFLGVVAGGLVGAYGERADGRLGVLQILAADLRHKRDRWA